MNEFQPESAGMLPGESESKIREVNFAELTEDEQAKYATRKATVLYLQALPERSAARRDAVLAAAEEHGVNKATIYKWIEFVKSGDELRLVKKMQPKRGRSIMPIVQAEMEMVYTQTHDKALAIKAAKKKADYLHVTIPSDKTLRRALEDMDKKEGGLLAYGIRARDHYNNVSLWTKRDWSLVKPMEVCFADGKRFDVLVEWWDGRLVYPWGCFWEDACTRTLFLPSICDRENSEAIAGSFRLMLRQGGLPETLHLDNGKTYKAVRLVGRQVKEAGDVRLAFPSTVTNILPQLSGLFNVAGRIIHAISYNSRTKPIERPFGIGGVDQFCTGLRGWTGNSYKRLPDHTQKMVDWYAKEKNRENIPPEYRALKVLDFYVLLAEWIDEYNSRPHRGWDMEGMSPKQAWNHAMAEGWRPTYIRDERILDALMMNAEKRKLGRNGFIELANHQYTSEDLKRRFARIGKPHDVLVRYEHTDTIMYRRRGVLKSAPREIAVYSMRPNGEPGEFIALGWTERGNHPLDREQLVESQRLKQRIEGEVRADYRDILRLGKEAQEYDLIAGEDPEINSGQAVLVPPGLEIYESAGRKMRLSKAKDELEEHKKELRRGSQFTDIDTLA